MVETTSRKRKVNVKGELSWTPMKFQVIFQKINETRFRVCGIRYRFSGSPTQKLYGVFEYILDISEASMKCIDGVMKHYYSGGINEIKKTFGPEANYVIADIMVQYIMPLDVYENGREYTTEDEALRAMQEYIKTELNGEQPEFEKHRQCPSRIMSECINVLISKKTNKCFIF